MQGSPAYGNKYTQRRKNHSSYKNLIKRIRKDLGIPKNHAFFYCLWAITNKVVHVITLLCANFLSILDSYN